MKKTVDAQKVEKGRDEDLESDGRTDLRELWNVWEQHGEHQQNIENVGDC